jgi:large subunit ribosomal protein L33
VPGNTPGTLAASPDDQTSDFQTSFTIMREYVWLECTETGMRNYRVQKETRGTERLELKKYCPKLRKHTVHKESRKK